MRGLSSGKELKREEAPKHERADDWCACFGGCNGRDHGGRLEVRLEVGLEVG